MMKVVPQQSRSLIPETIKKEKKREKRKLTQLHTKTKIRHQTKAPLKMVCRCLLEEFLLRTPLIFRTESVGLPWLLLWSDSFLSFSSSSSFRFLSLRSLLRSSRSNWLFPSSPGYGVVRLRLFLWFCLLRGCSSSESFVWSNMWNVLFSVSLLKVSNNNKNQY